jgi:hypothetical protein
MPLTICGPGGTGAPQPGLPEKIIFSATAITGLLSAAKAPWAIVLSSLIDVGVYDSIALCSVDPPAMPTMTAAEVDVMLNLDVANPLFSVGLGKLKDMVLNAAWFQFCQCTIGSATQPAAVAPAHIPTVYQGGPGTPCLDMSWQGTPAGVAGFGTDVSQGTDVGPYLFPSPAQRLLLFVGPVLTATWATYKIPDGWAPGLVGLTITMNGSNTTAEVFTIGWWNAAGTFLGSSGAQVGGAFGYPTTQVFPTVPAAAAYIGLGVKANLAAGAAVDTTCEFQIFGSCGAQSCCQPWEPVSAGPDAITSQLLVKIASLVTLIQRHRVPFAYVLGANHASLTGNGVLTIPNGLEGVLVLVTSSIPATVGIQPGGATRYFDLGWLNFGSSFAFFERLPLTADSQYFTPEYAGACTRLAYSLPPGVTITVAELQAET